MTAADDIGTTAVFALTDGAIATALDAARITGGVLWVPEGREPASSEAGGCEGGIEPGGPDPPGLDPGVPVRTFDQLGPALRAAFSAGNSCVCVLAAGIVVRLLAPVLSDKWKDPAVVVVDEAGRFAVPVLSGHQGGANALARLVARGLGGQAVITTSSDVQGLVAPDMLARRLEAEILEADLLTPITASLANGGKPELWFDPRELGGASSFLEELPGFRCRRVKVLGGDAFGADGGAPPDLYNALVVTTCSLEGGGDGGGLIQLVPRWVTAGVGCKWGRGGDAIADAVRRALDGAGLHRACLTGLATAEAKADEPGLHEAAAELGVPLQVCRNGDLQREIAERGCEVDDFVRTHAGVGAVCEPAALMAAGRGSVLVAEKQATSGITVALARAEGATVLERTEEDSWPS